MKKVFSLMLVLMLSVGILAGCGGGGEPSAAPASQKPASATPTATTTSTPAAGDPAGDGAYQLPIVNESQTLTIWCSEAAMANDMATLGDSSAVKEAEKRTNIHLEWTMAAAAGSNVEQFQLVLVSQEYRDLFLLSNSGRFFTKGTQAAMDDGVIIDLAPYLEEHAPNYLNVLNSDTDIKRRVTNDSGTIPAFRNIGRVIKPSHEGPLLRADMLAEANLSLPETYGEWHNTLSALKSYTEVSPLLFTNASGMMATFMMGFGLPNQSLGANMFVQENGVVKMAMLESGFKEYVETMADWYAEGLINPDFAGGNLNLRGEYAVVLGNKHAAFPAVFTFIDRYESESAVAGYELVAAKIPVKNKGDTYKSLLWGGQVNTANITVTTTCRNPELAIKYLDYYFTDEGSILAAYGVEGEGHYINDEGNPMLTELVANNPELNMSQAMSKYLFIASWPSYFHWEREYSDFMSDKAKEATYLWNSNYDGTMTYPTDVSFTAEESETNARYYNDIYTYTEENVVRFITGARSMSEWDSFVSQIEDMGAGHCIEVYQNALDRFNQR